MAGQENKYSFIFWIGRNISKLEMTFVLAFMLGMMFKMAGFGPFDLFIGFGLTFLAIVYFIYAFVPVVESEFINIILRKVMAISWAMVVVGIMFFYLSFPGFANQLMAGMLSLTLSFVVLLISGLRTGHWVVKSELIRSTIILLVGFYIIVSI